MFKQSKNDPNECARCGKVWGLHYGEECPEPEPKPKPTEVEIRSQVARQILTEIDNLLTLTGGYKSGSQTYLIFEANAVNWQVLKRKYGIEGE